MENNQQTQNTKPDQPSRPSILKTFILSTLGIVIACLFIFFGSKIYFCFMAAPNPNLSRNTFLNWRLSQANKVSLVPYKYIKKSSYDVEEYGGATEAFIKKAQAEMTKNTSKIKDDDNGEVIRLGLYQDGNLYVFPRTPRYHHTLLTEFDEKVLLRFHASVRSFFGPYDDKVNKTLADVKANKDKQLGGDLKDRMPKKYLRGGELPKSENEKLLIKIKEGSKLYDEVFIPLIKEDFNAKLKDFIINVHELLKEAYVEKKSIDVNDKQNPLFKQTKTLVEMVYKKDDYFHDNRPRLENNTKEIEKMKDADNQIIDFYQKGGQALWSPPQTYFYSMLLWQFRYLTFDVELEGPKTPAEKKQAGNRDLRVVNAFSFIFSRIYPESKLNEVSFFQKFFRPNSKDLKKEETHWVDKDTPVLWNVYDQRVSEIQKSS